ncbi:MAG: dTDP-4-amino-4,6-dideoxygalactose transaminase [Roseivirga sp.]
MNPIAFNKPYLSGKETAYIEEAVASGKISGNGLFTNRCQQFFEENYGFRKCLLTTSCTDALEMCALLLEIQPGDEVILPSYTFVSTANAFALRGAKLVFIDSREDHPGIDEHAIEELINSRTKAIVVVHYAGVAVDMDIVMELANKNNVFVVEDAAQAIDSYYKDQPLGGIGHLSTFSFHETKNIISGEGGMLVINDERFVERSEIIWEKGTNRNAFFRGEVDKYGWVDIGSSFLPSELVSAFLYAQLENLEDIQKRRTSIWKKYNQLVSQSEVLHTLSFPIAPSYATNNAHMFYLVFDDTSLRSRAIHKFEENNISAVFHYQGLHESSYYMDKHDGRLLPNCRKYSDGLLRLPFYYELSFEEVERVVKVLIDTVIDDQ